MAIEDVSTIMDGEGRIFADDFRDGFRILVVDDDIVSLKLMELMLHKCQYKVTLVNEATSALDILRQKTEQFDLVITDVHMPGMDGFDLLKHIDTEMDIPVIMISADCDYEVVKRGMTEGACDYIKKPPKYDNLKTIWRHVFRKGRKNSRISNIAGQQLVNVVGVSDRKGKKKRNCDEYSDRDETDVEENTYNSDGTYNQRKTEIVWSGERHEKFLEAVNRLGVEAVPMAILNVMNAIGPVEGHTRQIVVSHLQKFRNRSTRNNFNNVVMTRNSHPWNISGELPDNAAFRPNRFHSSLGRLNNSHGIGEKDLVPSRMVEHWQVGNMTSYSDRENAFGVSNPCNLSTGGVIEQQQYLGRILTSSALGKNQLMTPSMAEDNTWNSITDLRIHQGADNLGNRLGNMLHGRIANATDFPNSISEACLPVSSNTIPYNVMENILKSAVNQKDKLIGMLSQNSASTIPSMCSEPFMASVGDCSEFNSGRFHNAGQGVLPSNNDNDVLQACGSSLPYFPHVEIENIVQDIPTLCDPMCMSTDSPKSYNGRSNQRTDTSMTGTIASFLEEDCIRIAQETDMEYIKETSKLQCDSSYSGHYKTIPANTPEEDIDPDIDVTNHDNNDVIVDD